MVVASIKYPPHRIHVNESLISVSNGLFNGTFFVVVVVVVIEVQVRFVVSISSVLILFVVDSSDLVTDFAVPMRAAAAAVAVVDIFVLFDLILDEDENVVLLLENDLMSCLLFLVFC